MSWWEALPGVDWRYPPPDEEVAARLCSVVCAAKVLPLNVGRGGWGSPPTRKLAQELAAWLRGAGNGYDAWLRRWALCVTCDSAGPASRPDQILPAAKTLHAELAREPGAAGRG